MQAIALTHALHFEKAKVANAPVPSPEVVFDQQARRVRDQDLAAVGGRADASPPIDV